MFASIAITGVSIISALGDDPQATCAALKAGVAGLSPVSPDKTPEGHAALCGQVKLNFSERLGPTGWRHRTRSSLLASLAGRILLESASPQMFLPQREETGIALGYNADASVHLFFSSFFSSPENISRWVNPTAFINFSNNAPASLLSMQHQCRGPIFTVTTGFTAGLDALNIAATVMQGGETPAMLAGAVQEINPELLESFAVLPGETHGGILRSTTGGGVVAGEGCALMALEKLPEAESARARAWILGYGEALNFSDQPSQASAAIVQAARGALADSRLQASEITAVFLSANGNSPWDRAEAAALRVLFGQNPPPATALKGTWGECYHAGAAMTVAAAVLCLEKNFIPPTLNLTPGCQPSSLGLSPQAQTVQARYALILSLDRDKKATALILGFPKDGAC